MTIAQAFNEITVAQGGTPNYSGTISGAIDALNDALAGSDQPSAQTIEGAVRLLGQHIGGGGGGTAHSIACYSAGQQEITPIADCAYKGVWSGENGFVADTETGVVTELLPGEIFVLQPEGYQYPAQIGVASSIDGSNAVVYSTAPDIYSYPMPNADIVAIIPAP